jgi:hypothetical protein
MQFCFYPKHEYACPQVGHCPHLGGAALGTLVDAASEHDQYLQMLWGQLDSERQRNTRLFEENIQLQAQIEQLKLELKVERQSKFATSASLDQTESEPAASPASLTVDDGQPKKRGAPVGHPGWFRPQPSKYDRLIEVAAPCDCPHCGGTVHLFPNVDLLPPAHASTQSRTAVSLRRPATVIPTVIPERVSRSGTDTA